MKDQVLLVGNGINNIANVYTWNDLLTNLISHIGIAGQINTLNKPFPLLYEEIHIEAIKNHGISENKIKDFIGKEVEKLRPSELHDSILKLGTQNIITTNYELTFEKMLTYNPKELINNGAVVESKYSLFRNYSIEGRKTWHIHGDANYPNSILSDMNIIVVIFSK